MKDKFPKISIVILNHNTGQLLENCISSVLNTPNFELEVILVDNLSEDNSHKKCKELFPEITLIENKENLGYCAGNNVGIEKATGEFIVILNPDTEVTPTWLEKLVSAYEEHGEGLYQPKCLSLRDKELFDGAGNMIHIFGFGYSRAKGMKDVHQFEKDENVCYASGACLFTKTKTMKKIGMFDPFLFVYHDDLDLGWRAAHQGIKSFYIPSATIFHYGSFIYKWSPFKFFQLEKNRIYCLLTHYSKSTFYKILPSLILIEIIMFFIYLSKGLIKEKIRGYSTILKNRKHIRKRYEELESIKIISDKEFIKKFPDELFITEEVGKGLSVKIFQSVVKNLSRINKYVLGV